MEEFLMVASQRKIAIIFVVFQTDSQANGGVESITQLIEQLPDFSITVVTQNETEANKRWKAAGVKVVVQNLPYRMGSSFYRSSLSQKFLRIYFWIALNLLIIRLIKNDRTQIVHCNDVESVIHAAFGARIMGIPVIQNIRDIKPTDQPYGWHWRIVFLLCNHTVVLSQEMKEQVLTRLGRYIASPMTQNERVSYIYSIVNEEGMNPVDLAQQVRLRNALGMSNEQIAIGYVATFSAKKAQLEFIRKAGSFLLDVPNIKLYFIGDFDPERDLYCKQCLDAVKETGLQDVVSFVGYTSRVVDWYQALDIVVLASQNEGMARCMIESIACGTPVISFDVTSAREILEVYGCGHVVEQHDYKGMVEQIHKLATDAVYRKQLGQKGVRTARTLFATNSAVEKYKQLYFSLVTKQKRHFE